MSSGTSNTKVIVIQPGECAVLPTDAVIKSIVIDGSISISNASTCLSLPTPSTYKCGFFFLYVDQSVSGSRPLNEQDTMILSAEVGGKTININRLVVGSGDNPGSFSTTDDYNALILPADQAIFKFTLVNWQSNLTPETDDRSRVWFYFRVPSDLFNSTTLRVASKDNLTLYLKPYEATCESYPLDLPTFNN